MKKEFKAEVFPLSDPGVLRITFYPQSHQLFLNESYGFKDLESVKVTIESCEPQIEAEVKDEKTSNEKTA